MLRCLRHHALPLSANSFRERQCACQRSTFMHLMRHTHPLSTTDINVPQYHDLRVSHNTIEMANLNGRNLFVLPQNFVYGNENSSGSAVFTTHQKDGNLNAMHKLTFEDAPGNILELIDSETLLKLAKDRDGMQMLKSHFPAAGSFVRRKFFSTVLQQAAFNDLINHSSGNFLIQKMIEESNEVELCQIERMLSAQLPQLCNGCYGCRVVQQMIERIQQQCPSRLPGFIESLAGHERQLAVAQTGSHVLQKIFKCTSFEHYDFILRAFISSPSVLESVVEDKYGCRVVQLALQQLKAELAKSQNNNVSLIFNEIVRIMKSNALYFISHQYANYIMQDLLSLELETIGNRSKDRKLSEVTSATADMEIINTIVYNLLSLSQEKHASHVVEKAFHDAPEPVLTALMHDIFEGYENDRDGNDALNILMFDQYGNYVVQTMIDVALAVKQGRRKGRIEWYNRLVERVSLQQGRLLNFSSGKRIISKLIEV
uniref:PUM-HD domain-containing protein n=1 Tax=Syphacia muris TaxID=451379 RepID=A0A0N5AWT1_9BILA